jgi:hypothetical protein
MPVLEAVASGVWWPGPGEPASVRAQASWTTEPLSMSISYQPIPHVIEAASCTTSGPSTLRAPEAIGSVAWDRGQQGGAAGKTGRRCCTASCLVWAQATASAAISTRTTGAICPQRQAYTWRQSRVSSAASWVQPRRSRVRDCGPGLPTGPCRQWSAEHAPALQGNAARARVSPWGAPCSGRRCRRRCGWCLTAPGLGCG